MVIHNTKSGCTALQLACQLFYKMAFSHNVVIGIDSTQQSQCNFDYFFNSFYWPQKLKNGENVFEADEWP